MTESAKSILVNGLVIVAGIAAGTYLSGLFQRAQDDKACAANAWECSTNIAHAIYQQRNKWADAETKRLTDIIGDQKLSNCDRGIILSLALIGAEAQVQEQVRSVTLYPQFAGSAVDVKQLSEDRIAAGANDFICAATKSYPDYFATPRPDVVAQFAAPYTPK